MELISREKVKNTILDFGGFNTWEDKSELMYEISFVPSAFEGMTNGEVMKTVYVDSEIEIDEAWKTVTVFFGADEDYCEDEVRFDLDWWNAPYQKRKSPEEVIGVGNAEKMGKLIDKLTESLSE